jgi:hypothetical protein
LNSVSLTPKAALKNNFSSEGGTTEARTPEKQAFLANLDITDKIERVFILIKRS